MAEVELPSSNKVYSQVRVPMILHPKSAKHIAIFPKPGSKPRIIES